MRRFAKIGQGLDTAPILEQIGAHPELWDEITYRKQLAEHAEMSDIWLRYRPLEDVQKETFFPGPFFCAYYPAWWKLPSIHPVVNWLKMRVDATYLGAILITRIPPGGRIKPHNDAGMWHADFHNAKVYIPLITNAQCVNYAEDESVVMGTGEFWLFDNLCTHSLENRGNTDRISLIVAMRNER